MTYLNGNQRMKKILDDNPELRPAVKEARELSYSMAPISLRQTIEETLYEHVTSFKAVNYEETVDAILEAIVSSLPEKRGEKHPDFGVNWDFTARENYNQALDEVTSIIKGEKR